MLRNIILTVAAINLLAACSSTPVVNGPYQPASKPEKIEFARDRIDVYPDDFRKDPTNHAGIPVAWVGVIVSTDAREADTGDKIIANSVFEQHYFDWVQDSDGGGIKLIVSPRGEGLFRTKWSMDKKSQESSADSAEQFAARGNLAVVYGVPEKVDPDGTVVLKYRYLRILDSDHFTTNDLDYGRLKESLCGMKTCCKSNAMPVMCH